MTVRAKFKVDSISRMAYSQYVYATDTEPAHTVPTEMRSIKMSPVYANGDPNHENNKFWNATPSGSLELGCVNLAAAEGFELGAEYYIDVTLASPSVPPVTVTDKGE